MFDKVFKGAVIVLAAFVLIGTAYVAVEAYPNDEIVDEVLHENALGMYEKGAFPELTPTSFLSSPTSTSLLHIERDNRHYVVVSHTFFSMNQLNLYELTDKGLVKPGN